jgi:hypothetical protein
MSVWKKEALARLPEYSDIITRYDLKATAVWAELRPICEAAHVRGDLDLLRRIYDYAQWCWQSPAPHLRRAVEFAFYQHAPIIPTMRRDMPRLFTRSEFDQLREPFSRLLSSEDMKQLEREFEAK